MLSLSGSSLPEERSVILMIGSGPWSEARSASRVVRVHTVMLVGVGSVSLMPVAWCTAAGSAGSSERAATSNGSEIRRRKQIIQRSGGFQKAA